MPVNNKTTKVSSSSSVKPTVDPEAVSDVDPGVLADPVKEEEVAVKEDADDQSEKTSLEDEHFAEEFDDVKEDSSVPTYNPDDEPAQEEQARSTEEGEDFVVYESTDGRRLEAQIGTERFEGYTIRVPRKFADEVGNLLRNGGYRFK